MEKIGTQIGTKSNRLERTERAQIGVASRRIYDDSIGLRTIGTEIGGMTIAMIGLRIAHMMIRFGRLDHRGSADGIANATPTDYFSGIFRG